jgi:lipopolysaccharide export LptBFGC system permease protein LptF
VYFFLLILIKPSAEKNISEIESKSEFAQEVWSQIDSLSGEAEENKQTLIPLLEEYQLLFPNDEEAAVLYDQIQLEESTREPRPESAVMYKDEEESDLSAASYIRMANTYFNQGDFYSAHYYASLALQLNDQREDAKRIVSKSWEKIQNPEKSETDAVTDYNKRKADAYQMLNKGEYLKAYNLFKQLEKENTSDSEVSEFLTAAEESLERSSYFESDARQALQNDGSFNVFFQNSPDSKHFIYFKKLVSTITGIYVLEPEIIKLDNTGSLEYLVTAPYGQINIDGQLNTKGISEGEDSQYLTQDVLAGERTIELAHLYELTVPVQFISSFTLQDVNLDNVPFLTLFKLSNLSSQYGYSPLPFRLTLINKIAAPFSFLFLSFIAVSVGWKLRSSYSNKPSIFAYILIPIIPFMIHLILSFFNYYLINVTSGFFLLYTSFPVTIVIVILIEVLLFISAMISLAGQVTRRS